MAYVKKIWREPLAGYDPWACDLDTYRFDVRTAERVCAWWEEHLTLSKAGTPFVLERWQRQIVGHLFGWKRRADGVRRYRKLWFYVPRKNGKTELGAGLAIIAMVADNEPGAEVYSAAKDTEQAKRVYEAASAMVRRAPALSKAVRIYDGYKAMKYAEAMAYWRVLSSDAGGKHGLNPHCYIIDEVHVQHGTALMDALETGTGARRQPIAVYLTTADYARESACNELLEYAKRVRDEQIDDRFLPVIYELEQDVDWHDPANWRAVNPNLGVSLSMDDMEAQHQKAVLMPSFENEFKRLRLNIQTSAQNKWLDVTDWDVCKMEDVHLDDLAGEECYASVDMGATRDLTACGLFFPEHLLFACHFWSPQAQVDTRIEYQQWIKGGWMTATPGRTINSDYIRQYILTVAKKYKLLNVAYDRWNAAELAFRLGQEDGIPIVEFRQGYRSINEPSKKLERMLLDQELRHRGNPVLRWMVGNVEILTDPAGNIKPVKPHKDSPQKIDGIVCLVMCLGLWINNEADRPSRGMEERYAATGDAMLVLG